jgi:hypothetical protein
MKRWQKRASAAACALLLGSGFGLVGTACDRDEGAFEEAGEAVDEAGDRAEERADRMKDEVEDRVD